MVIPYHWRGGWGEIKVGATSLGGRALLSFSLQIHHASLYPCLPVAVMGVPNRNPAGEAGPKNMSQNTNKWGVVAALQGKWL